MNLGMLVRADDRGLGTQTWEAWRHLRPSRTLVIDMEGGTPYQQRWERYEGSWGRFRPFSEDPETVRPFLRGLDALYTAETPYRDELLSMARQEGVATVIQGNFEFLRWVRDPSLPRPDLFWAPSPWRLSEWPHPTKLLPFPVDRERLPFRHRTRAESFLHVAGHATQADRNGTWLFLQALQHVHTPIRVVLTTQDAVPSSLLRHLPRCVDIDVREGDVEDYWRLYDEGDVLVIPRRFGGLSLPMQEAASAGLAVVSLDLEPQRGYLRPEALVPAKASRWFESGGGRVDIYDADPADLAAKIMELASTPSLVERLSRESDLYAESISWKRLGPVYESELAALAAR